MSLTSDQGPRHRPGAPRRRVIGADVPGWTLARVVAVTLVVALLAVLITWRVVPRGSHGLNLLAGLPRNGVVAADVGAPQSRGAWVVTSGSLLTKDGALWSGIPDAGPPDPTHGRTGSSVLRAVSRSRDFGDVTVHLRLRLNGLVTTTRTPLQAWDGVHVFLRYRSPNELYAVDLSRRDGTLAIKRKTPQAPGTPASETAGTEPGSYVQLAGTTAPLTPGEHSFDVAIRNRGDAVELTLAVDGRTILSTLDTGSAALRAPGGVGLRGDNADFLVPALIVRGA